MLYVTAIAAEHSESGAEADMERPAHTQQALTDAIHGADPQVRPHIARHAALLVGGSASDRWNGALEVILAGATCSPVPRTPGVTRRSVAGTPILDALLDGTIRWGHKLAAVTARDGGTPGYRLRFDNGEEITTDLLIGADGAWSRVRPLLSNATLAYWGVSIEGDLPDGDRYPAERKPNGKRHAVRAWW